MNPSEAVTLVLSAAALGAAAFALAAWLRRGPEDPPLGALLRLVLDLYLRLYHGIRWTPGRPAAPIPLAGPAIVVANHRSGVDPLAIAGCTRRVVHFLMAREYYEQRGLRWLFRTTGAIAVNRDGSDLGATKAALKALREGGVIGIFPEGGIRFEGTEEMVGGKAGAALLALRTGAPVVPAFITGTPNYDSVLRSLVTPSRSRVRFGEPLYLPPPAGKKPTREEIEAAAGQIFERIQSLAARQEEPSMRRL